MSYRPNLNYFSHPSYVTQDSDAGVLRSRGGTRLLGISDDFLRGFVLACEDEAGSATPLLLRRCGSFYGQRLAERIERELQSFADTPLHSRTMPEFAALVEDLWNGLGMGRITADYRHVQLGLIAVQLQHSPMQDIGPKGHTADDLLCGIIEGFFRYFTGAGNEGGEGLRALQTGDQRLGDREGTTFILGFTEVTRQVEALIAQRLPHSEILKRLGV